MAPPASAPPVSRMVKLRITSEALAAAAAAAVDSRPTATSAPPVPKESKPKKPKKPRPSKAAHPPSAVAPRTPSSSSSASLPPKSTAAPAVPPPPAPTPTGTVPPVLPKIKFKGSSLNQAHLARPHGTPHPPTKPTLKLKSSSFKIPSTPHGTPIPSAAIPTPTIKLKHKPKPTHRKRRHEPGNGYDSEASDREDDPAIEEQFILRMQPGPDCDYLRELIERKELSASSDVWFKFKDSRRCVVSVRDHLYGATLYDLPTILESSKTLDKKNIFKTADVCQILLVHGRIQHESEVLDKNYGARNGEAGPGLNGKDWNYPHGITPPMHACRRRRFRKRVSNRTIEAVEQEVERLLRKDEEAASTKFELVDAAELRRQAEEEEAAQDAGYDLLGEQGEYESDNGGEGEEGYDFFGDEDDAEGDVDEDTLAIDLESALMGLGEEDGADSGEASGANALSSVIKEESDDDEDADEDEVGQLDEEALERQQMRERILEEMKELQDAYRAKESEMGRLQNALLRQRCQKVMDAFASQLEMKQKELLGLGG